MGECGVCADGQMTTIEPVDQRPVVVKWHGRFPPVFTDNQATGTTDGNCFHSEAFNGV